MKNTLIFSAVLLLSGCASAGLRNNHSAAPDWVSGASALYPREKYMLGTGSGEDLPSARDRAAGEIAKIFSTLVTVTTRVSESEKTAAENGVADTSSSRSVSQDVKSVARKVLTGVETAQTWQDPGSGRYFALALLDRQKAAASLRARVGEIDALMDEYGKSLEKASGRLEPAGYSLKLLALLKERGACSADLKVVSPGSSAGAPDEAAIRSRASAAISALDISVKFTGDDSSAVLTETSRALNSLGLPSGQGEPGRQPDIIIEGAVITEQLPSPPGSPWKWARSAVSLSVREGAAGKTVVSFELSDRQAAAGPEEARRRSLISLGQKAGRQASEGLITYFESR